MKISLLLKPSNWRSKILSTAIQKKSNWQFLITSFLCLDMSVQLRNLSCSSRKKVLLSLSMEHMLSIRSMSIWLLCNLMPISLIFISGAMHLRVLLFCILVTNIFLRFSRLSLVIFMERDQQENFSGVELETSLLFCLCKKVLSTVNLLDQTQSETTTIHLLSRQLEG